MSEGILLEISENLQRGKAKVVKELIPQALEAGIDPETILNDGLLALRTCLKCLSQPEL